MDKLKSGDICIYAQTKPDTLSCSWSMSGCTAHDARMAKDVKVIA